MSRLLLTATQRLKLLDNCHGRNIALHRSLHSVKNDGANVLCVLFREIGNRLELVERTPRLPVNNQPGFDLFHKTSTSSLTSDFCKAYLALPQMSVPSLSSRDALRDEISSYSSTKHQFLELLTDIDFGIDESMLTSTMANILSHKRDVQHSDDLARSSIIRLRELCSPKYERIFKHILGSSQRDLAVDFLVKLRQDIREVIQVSDFNKDDDGNQQCINLNKLRAIERDIQSTLTSLFRPGVLVLQKITYDKTPASIIEQIAFKEAVHPLQSLKDLRTRLGPGRRCYAFFHPALKDRPLVFVHVALLRDIPNSMDKLQEGTQRIVDGIDLESQAICATFYSITNAEPGLAGVDLGNYLIKSVVQVLADEFPNLTTFCTLSPIPNFRKWLEGKLARNQEFTCRLERIDPVISGDISTNASTHGSEEGLITPKELKLLKQQPLNSVVDILKDCHYPTATEHSVGAHDDLKALLLKLAAYYLTVETHHGRPLCPVAKFHVRNGAEMYRLNYMGDKTTKGLRNSFGIMINYRYSLQDLEENHVNYEKTGVIVVRDGVKCWLGKNLPHLVSVEQNDR